MALRIAFWLSTSLILYTYVGYPLLLLALAAASQVWGDLRFALGRGERRRSQPAHEPRLSLVFAAYNEESVIEDKMRNCAALGYPAERLEILVGCDGCTDQTVARARAAAPPNAQVFEFSGRSGKPEVLNRLVASATGDIVVFSDANTMLDPRALGLLARHFADPDLGCVCGNLRLSPSEGGSGSESLYWRYEGLLKFMESRLGLLLGANGGIYAMRRELYVPLPAGAIIDDFLIAMRVRGAGRRVIFDAEAFATELASARVEDEFRRKVRIGAGNFHAVRFTAGLLSPTAGRIAFSYWSHKVFRWVVPIALVVALATALALAAEPLYRWLAIAGFAFLGLAALGRILERRGVYWGLFSAPYYFVSMNVALFLGLIRFLKGTQKAAWNRTERPATPAAAVRQEPPAGS